MRSVVGFGLDAEWQQSATELVKPPIDIYFSLNDGSHFHDIYSANFEYPPIEREFTDSISTAEIIGNEQHLVNYYRQIVEAARHYKIPFRGISHLFWLRLKIRNRSGPDTFSFTYYDSLREITKFQDWVNHSDTDVLYSDLDQGWGFEAQKKHPFIYMIEYDPDYQTYTQANFVEYLHLQNELAHAINRTRQIIKVLTENIGNDLWSTNRSYPWDDASL